MSQTPKPKLLIAASGTGGHIFPALALAQNLSNYEIEWLGVPNRLENQLVPSEYPLHSIAIEGFQGKSPLKNLKIAFNLLKAIFQTRTLLQQRHIDIIFTTGGYIAAPVILAGKWLKIPVILHESNYIPGKVTRLFGPLCSKVALGFQGTSQLLKLKNTLWVSTPVRSSFLTPQPLDFPIPRDVPLIVVMGGSQGAVKLNQLVRDCLPQWFSAGYYVVHLTGANDPDTNSIQHPQYFALPFYENMAGLLQRATMAISRAGAGTITELAVTHTPAILIPYPFAAEDHQTYNALEYVKVGAGILIQQKDLTKEKLHHAVVELMESPQLLEMGKTTEKLAVKESVYQLATLLLDTPRATLR